MLLVYTTPIQNIFINARNTKTITKTIFKNIYCFERFTSFLKAVGSSDKKNSTKIRLTLVLKRKVRFRKS